LRRDALYANQAPARISAPVTSIVRSKIAADGWVTTLFGGSEAPRWLSVSAWVL
jgi:hypothetical protein